MTTSLFQKIIPVLLLIFLATPYVSLAQNPDPAGLKEGFTGLKGVAKKVGLPEVADPKNPAGIVFTILQFVLGFLAVIAIIALIYAGFMYITAGGDEKKTEKAKSIIIYTVIGLVIIGGAGIVVNALIVILFP